MTAVQCSHSTDFAEFRPVGIWKSNFEGSKRIRIRIFFFEVRIFELRLTSLDVDMLDVWNGQMEWSLQLSIVWNRNTELLLIQDSSPGENVDSVDLRLWLWRHVPTAKPPVSIHSVSLWVLLIYCLFQWIQTVSDSCIKLVWHVDDICCGLS